MSLVLMWALLTVNQVDFALARVDDLVFFAV